ncbi:MAG: histidine phosphatase family protein [Hyphomicrobiales bacterium]|nr:histidine phosphatase family protein [Hyphomicrobiales bacterium]
MKRLILLRHAKTEASNMGGDHARALVERGRSDSALIASFLQSHELHPDHVLCSDATRTRQTLACLQSALEQDTSVVFSARLYLAEPEALMHEIWAAPGEAQTLLLIGHNPGLHELAYGLTGHAARQLRSQLLGNFPTAAMAVLTFDSQDWSEIAAGGGTLEHFVTAKSLRPSGTGDGGDGKDAG